MQDTCQSGFQAYIVTAEIHLAYIDATPEVKVIPMKPNVCSKLICLPDACSFGSTVC